MASPVLMLHSRLSWTSVILLAAAAFTLGQALQVNNGFFHGRAILWLTVSLAILGAACLAGRWRLPLASPATLRVALLAGILFQVAQLLTDAPLLYSPLRHGRDDGILAVSLGAMGLLAIAVTVAGTAVRRVAFAGILAAHLVSGVRAVQLVPEPQIDVVTVQEAAIDALVAGQSPYGITFKNVYGSSTRFYGEGLASEEEVWFGFPYPPLSLAFVAPAHLLFGEYRYAAVAALAGVGLMLASFGWSRHAMLGATLLLTTPRVLFEIEQGWTEPFVLFMLVVLVVALRHRPANAGVAAGLAMAVKQYFAVALLLLPLMPAGRRASRHTLAIALASAAAITLPFLIWDFEGFMKSAVTLQWREPFRLDSLSYLAWMARRGWQPPGIAVTLIALALATVFVRRTLPRSPAGFAAAMAIVTVAAFAFGKKAFCNYYFFVIGALLTSVAASEEDRSQGLREADLLADAESHANPPTRNFFRARSWRRFLWLSS